LVVQCSERIKRAEDKTKTKERVKWIKGACAKWERNEISQPLGIRKETTMCEERKGLHARKKECIERRRAEDGGWKTIEIIKADD